ncbi:hypothetical protein HanIR_Chr11g0502651 [Helianthus annuus]|nr:hypothetical protein HanIR_Chr11g0502651 [Helianthus annuus]
MRQRVYFLSFPSNMTRGRCAAGRCKHQIDYPSVMSCVNHMKIYVSTYSIQPRVTYISIAVKSKRNVNRIYVVQV